MTAVKVTNLSVSSASQAVADVAFFGACQRPEGIARTTIRGDVHQ
jgi:hypothetical protein